MEKRVLLIILDGWGVAPKSSSNAIAVQGSPNLDRLLSNYPNSLLKASGEEVGLPKGQMGNSEVGHLNIGAGRVLYQDLVRINRDIERGELYNNPAVRESFDYVKKNGKALHFMGLLSDGGVHSSLEHLFAFLKLAKEKGIEKVYIHAFMDGRDTDPKGGLSYIEQLERELAVSGGKLASLIGRFYAMDRDRRWERVKEAYQLLRFGVGTPFREGREAIQSSYADGVTDEFVKPSVIVDESGKPIATLKEGDGVIFFNFRNDRARQLTSLLTQNGERILGMEPIPLHFSTLTPYDDKFVGLNILYQKENVKNTLGEVLAKSGKKQLRMAETEKYAHVTFFFSGGREALFENEERILIDSPKVATYDLKPEMSANQLKERLIEVLKKREHHFILLNFANCDMVGHTGNFEAIKKGVETVDSATGELVEVAKECGYTTIITADHGNADFAINSDGTPNTAHTTNPVPFIVVDNQVEGCRDGILADIAPTILKLMGLENPVEMTGKSLI